MPHGTARRQRVYAALGGRATAQQTSRDRPAGGSAQGCIALTVLAVNVDNHAGVPGISVLHNSERGEGRACVRSVGERGFTRPSPIVHCLPHQSNGHQSHRRTNWHPAAAPAHLVVAWRDGEDAVAALRQRHRQAAHHVTQAAGLGPGSHLGRHKHLPGARGGGWAGGEASHVGAGRAGRAKWEGRRREQWRRP